MTTAMRAVVSAMVLWTLAAPTVALVAPIALTGAASASFILVAMVVVAAMLVTVMVVVAAMLVTVMVVVAAMLDARHGDGRRRGDACHRDGRRRADARSPCHGDGRRPGDACRHRGLHDLYHLCDSLWVPDPHGRLLGHLPGQSQNQTHRVLKDRKTH